MSRIPQPAGQRGSLKWIQRAVNEDWPSLSQPILERIGGAGAIDWRSPLASDDHAEYRDAAFLDRLDLPHLNPALAEFWPARGPQWDALGRTSQGDILLIEAKAHVGEICSPASAASEVSRRRIVERLDATAAWLGARLGHAPWSEIFYQLANRISHLHWLQTQGVRAWLVLVNFVGDGEMGGPATPEAWHAAYQVAFHVMGLSKRHRLAQYVVEIFPDVSVIDGR